MDLLTKDDLLPILRRKAGATTAETVQSSTFRQPELYGIPIFVIGYGGRVAHYAGQYIAHREIRKYLNGKTEVYWRIITGFVRVFAEHKSGAIVEIFSNGLPSVGFYEFINSPKDFRLFEDVKENEEIEVPEQSLINIEGVLNGEDAFLLIDATGVFRELPHDLFARYSELRHAYSTLQRQLYDASETIKDLRFELDFVQTENRVLRQQTDRLKLRIASVAGALIHYKDELLRQKELMSFYISRLEAVKDGRDRLEGVLSDLRKFSDTFADLAVKMAEEISKVEKLKAEVEALEAEAEKLKQKKEALKPEEKKEEKKEETKKEEKKEEVKGAERAEAEGE
jgi:regulator of replication initiation timing